MSALEAFLPYGRTLSTFGSRGDQNTMDRDEIWHAFLLAQMKTPCRLKTLHREKLNFVTPYWTALAIDWSGLPQVLTLMCNPIVTSKVAPMFQGLVVEQTRTLSARVSWHAPSLVKANEQIYDIYSLHLFCRMLLNWMVGIGWLFHIEHINVNWVTIRHNATTRMKQSCWTWCSA